ncbi:hypothetical protein BDA96_03G315300 [Sorghum bicolor]|uniref:Uncharacterized protein n=2 Tax=Sorghum bicolor TaxID=4558 RepID=C5XJZ8_SORBI|nr:uncharacterized protein LOC8075555 [Sorghum bicolor]EES01458.2 hypothetical protein SORBI_3003G291900 [Sorghum bicolor]KAG0539346.1 hypothetical protein BDA96_03G315300 [Sorghum bicolor]OQU87510.1 hypothetical protein SORBI_3003G291900 [Sorghum bicolor]OQU87511.1 hypothetical protein SORBI_3003G291900 [Sorghum bicolor]|eukprot:XP_021311380.1 uncharacterized protein LOC8075555 [Sorghum bicolor]
MAAEGSDPTSPASAPPPPPPPKRRKIEPPRRTRPSQVTPDKDNSVASSNSSPIPGSLPARVDLNKVREAKRFAVLQAQHEGCLGSYKSFDSLFGNYLVPVVPTNDFFDQVGTKP